MTQQKDKKEKWSAQANRTSAFLLPSLRAGKACAAIQKYFGTECVRRLCLITMTIGAILFFSTPAIAACPGSCGDDKTERVVFVSNAEVAAQSLGGISGGDALCQGWADAAGLEGNYLAWLGDDTTDPATRFEQSTVPYVMVNGTKIADDWTDLTDGTLDSLFRVTETNGTNDGFALSNVDTDGTVFSPNATQHCNNFTSSAGGAIIQIGRNQFTNFNWTRASNSACTSTFPLYCFEQQTACSTPAGHAGEIIFNRDYRAMEYCDGTNWISMGKEASVLHGQKTTSDKQMIAWYRMDATSGTEETDYSPVENTGNYGSLDPATQYEPGISGTAINFANNTNALLSVTNPIYNDLDTVTISAWVKADGTYDGVMGIVGIGNLFKLRSAFNNDIIQFTLNSWTGSGTWSVSPARLTADTWQHIAVTYSYNDPVGTAPKIYVDGVLQGGGYNVAPTGTFTPDNGSPVQIGKRNDSSGGNFHGLIDDVRIYNYILDAAEIAELYAASDMPYQPNAVAFDGTDYLEENALAVSPSPRMTFSTWFRVNDFAARRQIFENLAANVWLYVRSDGHLHFRMEGPGNVPIFGTTLDGTGIGSSTDWHHLLLSVDTASPGRIQAYLDDVEIHNTTGAIVPTDVDIAFGNVMRIGRSLSTGGSDYMNGDMADFWMDIGTYIDLSDANNRRKFISAAGEAVFLGNNGELVTGDPPDIFLSGDTDNWHTNKGTGGGFTEYGALTNAATKPAGGASIIPRYCSNPVQPAGTLIFNTSENVMQYCDGYQYIPLSAPGLGAGGCVSPSGLAGEMVFNTTFSALQYCDGDGWVSVGASDMYASLQNDDLLGWWKLSETTGLSASDSSGNNNPGALSGGLDFSANSVSSGPLGQALDFDGANDYINAGTSSVLKPVLPLTVSAWINWDGTSYFPIVRSDYQDDRYSGFWLVVAPTQNLEIAYGNNAGIPEPAQRQTKTVNYAFSAATWYHIVGVIRGPTDMDLYINGVDVGGTYSGSGSTMVYGSGLPFVIGKHDSNVSNPPVYPDGLITDVRLYGRALSPSEVLALYSLYQ